MDRFRAQLHRRIKALATVAQPAARANVVGVGAAIEDLAAHLDERQRELSSALTAQGNAQQHAIYDAWRLLAEGLYIDLGVMQGEIAEIQAALAIHGQQSHEERAQIRRLIEELRDALQAREAREAGGRD